MNCSHEGTRKALNGQAMEVSLNRCDMNHSAATIGVLVEWTYAWVAHFHRSRSTTNGDPLPLALTFPLFRLIIAQLLLTIAV